MVMSDLMICLRNDEKSADPLINVEFSAMMSPSRNAIASACKRVQLEILNDVRVEFSCLAVREWAYFFHDLANKSDSKIFDTMTHQDVYFIE